MMHTSLAQLTPLSMPTPIPRTMYRPAPSVSFPSPGPATAQSGQWRIELIDLLEGQVPFARSRVHAGDRVQSAGAPFDCLRVVKLGACKSVNLSADGRERVVGLHFKGDWIGFDNIARTNCTSDVYALDTSEIWTLSYEALMDATAISAPLARALNFAMSCQLAQASERQQALGGLGADARVADFVRSLAESQAARNLRWDQINLRMSRAEIGSYLGLTLETVSRALSRLARCGLIGVEKNRQRHIGVPSILALVDYIQLAIHQRETRSLQEGRHSF
jgi:CRP/FNR family transcriptional regulator, anaerobic regulatory protein